MASDKPETKEMTQGHAPVVADEKVKQELRALRSLATSSNANKQKILVQKADSTMQYTLSVIAKPNATPTVGFSILKIRGRGAWGIPITSMEQIDSMISMLQELKQKYADYVKASTELYEEDVKNLKGIVQ